MKRGRLPGTACRSRLIVAQRQRGGIGFFHTQAFEKLVEREFLRGEFRLGRGNGYFEHATVERNEGKAGVQLGVEGRSFANVENAAGLATASG